MGSPLITAQASHRQEQAPSPLLFTSPGALSPSRLKIRALEGKKEKVQGGSPVQDTRIP